MRRNAPSRPVPLFSRPPCLTSQQERSNPRHKPPAARTRGGLPPARRNKTGLTGKRPMRHGENFHPPGLSRDRIFCMMLLRYAETTRRHPGLHRFHRNQRSESRPGYSGQNGNRGAGRRNQRGGAGPPGARIQRAQRMHLRLVRSGRAGARSPRRAGGNGRRRAVPPGAAPGGGHGVNLHRGNRRSQARAGRY